MYIYDVYRYDMYVYDIYVYTYLCIVCIYVCEREMANYNSWDDSAPNLLCFPHLTQRGLTEVRSMAFSRHASNDLRSR